MSNESELLSGWKRSRNEDAWKEICQRQLQTGYECTKSRVERFFWKTLPLIENRPIAIFFFTKLLRTLTKNFAVTLFPCLELPRTLQIAVFRKSWFILLIKILSIYNWLSMGFFKQNIFGIEKYLLKSNTFYFIQINNFFLNQKK